MEGDRKGGKKKKERRKRRGPAGQGHVSGLSPPPNIFLPATQRLNNNNNPAPVDSQRRHRGVYYATQLGQNADQKGCPLPYTLPYFLFNYHLHALAFSDKENKNTSWIAQQGINDKFTCDFINNNKEAWSWRRG